MRKLVLDTSAVVNLLATGKPRLLLSSCGFRVVLPRQVLREVTREPHPNIETDCSLSELVESGLLQVVDESEELVDFAIDLAGAPSPDDLDDGEAYAIALSVLIQASLVIDERKGRRVLRSRFPEIQHLYSIEFIDLSAKMARISVLAKGDLLFSALHFARMRVPRDKVADVIELIGDDRAKQCPSLGPRK